MAQPVKFKTGVRIDDKIVLSQETASKALSIDSSGKITSSVTTDAELAHLSGVTSSVQDQLDSAQSGASDAQADIDAHISDTTGAHTASAISVTPSGNLAADDVQEALQELQGDADSLDSRLDAVEPDVADLITLSGVSANATTLGTFTGTLIPDNSTVKSALQSLETEIESLPDPIVYKGTWDASTNTPTLANADTGKSGWLYQVTAAGSVNFGAGAISFEVGDKVVNNGTTWDKWDMTDSVASVFGRAGTVTAQSGDYSATQVTFTPSGDIAATNVQTAIEELDTEKASISAVSGALDDLFGQALVTSSGTTYDAVVDIHYYVVTGTVAQTFRMPDLTLTRDGDTYEIINRSTQTITVQTSASGAISTLKPQARMTLAAAVSSWRFHVLPIYSSVDGSINLGSVKITNLTDGSAATDAAAYGQVTAVQTNLTNHLTDTSDAHDASAISFDGTASSLAATDVQDAIDELAARPSGSTGDIQQSSFSIASSASSVNVTGLVFSPASVRGFEVLASITVDATADLYETFKICGIQRGSDFQISVESVGDDSGITFEISSSGQITYSSPVYAGFVSGTLKFRAIVTNV